MSVKILYRKDRDYRICPVSGVHGGATPHGLVNVDFFIEKVDLPEGFEVNKKTGKETPISDETKVIREVQFAIAVRPEIAREIGEFFIALANEQEKMTAGRTAVQGKGSDITH